MKPSSQTYLGFGTKIRSKFPLEDLLEVSGPPDVTIDEGLVDDSEITSLFSDGKVFERPGARFRFAPDAVYLEWDRVGKVLIRHGKKITVERSTDTSMEDLSPFLTGPVLAVLLHQREYFVMHASSVAINGAAIVFAGPKGHGKSTLAAHLKEFGHRVVSDDLVPLTSRASGIWAEPGFPRIKLFDDSIEAIGESPMDFPPIHRFASKRSIRLTEEFDQSSIPLGAIYILNEAPEFNIEKMSRSQAFIEIMANTYLNCFLMETGRQRSYFHLCDEIANSVPVFRLNRPSSFQQMPNIIAGLESHIDDAAS